MPNHRRNRRAGITIIRTSGGETQSAFVNIRIARKPSRPTRLSVESVMPLLRLFRRRGCLCVSCLDLNAIESSYPIQDIERHDGFLCSQTAHARVDARDCAIYFYCFQSPTIKQWSFDFVQWVGLPVVSLERYRF